MVGGVREVLQWSPRYQCSQRGTSRAAPRHLGQAQRHLSLADLNRASRTGYEYRSMQAPWQMTRPGN
jgi:hypothetical protein